MACKIFIEPHEPALRKPASSRIRSEEAYSGAAEAKGVPLNGGIDSSIQRASVKRMRLTQSPF